MLETLFIIVGFALILIFTGVKMVPQGHAWTVERFGRYTRTLGVGLHLLVPFMDRIGHKMITMEQVLDVEARERLAEAEANATLVVSKAIAAGSKDAINYFIAQGYTKALQAIASSPNSKIIMMPLEAASLIGSIAGIKDLLEQTGEGRS